MALLLPKNTPYQCHAQRISSQKHSVKDQRHGNSHQKIVQMIKSHLTCTVALHLQQSKSTNIDTINVLCYLQSTLHNWDNRVDWDNSYLLCPHKISAWRHCYQGARLDPLQRHQNLWNVPWSNKCHQRSCWTKKYHDLHDSMNFTAWKMCEESRRGSCSSFIAGPFEIFSELGMHSHEPFDAPLDHAALIAYLGLPCLGRWICGLIWRFGLVKTAALETQSLDETNTLQLAGLEGWQAKLQDSALASHHGADITEPDYIMDFFQVFNSDLGLWTYTKCGSCGAPASWWLRWYFGVGGANPSTHVTQTQI